MHTVKLTNGELSVILSALHDLKRDGVYWGPKDTFYRIRDRVIGKLEQLEGEKHE